MSVLQCPRCGESHNVETFTSVNTAKDPDLKARVKDGSLFVWECPHCGAKNLIKGELLYHDPEEKLMVWLLPEGARPPGAVEEAVKQLEGYSLRRVADAGSLIEKVNIHEAGLDDVTVEMLKMVTRTEMSEKTPAVQDVPMKFFRLDGPDNDIILSFPLDGSLQAVTVGFNVYEDCRSILSRNPSIAPAPGFAVVDSAWIESFFR